MLLKQCRINQRRVLVTLGMLLLFWWSYLRHGVPSFNPWITWTEGGAPRSVTFQISHQGQAVVGLEVEVESQSGTSGAQITNELGIATFLHQGEDEVIGIHLNHERIPLRPLPLGETWFWPSCREGLVFSVSI